MDIVFPASMEYLREMLQWIRIPIQSAGFDSEETSKIELALEEAIVNIIKHGYSQRPGDVAVSVRPLSTGGVKITLKDRGIPYNPLANVKSLDRNAPAEHRTIGGYGIHFILQIMDEVAYEREGESNILHLIKRT